MAALSATQIGSLIVQDGRPILVLTTYGARVFTTVAQLKQLIAEGKVRYAFLNTFCSRHGGPLNPACSEPAKWMREHGTDVSREAGLRQRQDPLAAAGSEAVTLATEQQQIAALADGARAAGRLALDTEFMGEGRYRTLLCLIQLAIPEEPDAGERIVLVDPLAESLDGSPLASVLADPAVQVVVHAGRQDVALMRRRFDTEVRNVFDTQVAAGFAGLGAQSSYESLLTEILGLRVAKTASFTRWDARPALARAARLRARGRRAPARARGRARAAPGRERARWSGRARSASRSRPRATSATRETIFARLPRIASLNAAARAVARELVEWRERPPRARTGRCRACSATRR